MSPYIPYLQALGTTDYPFIDPVVPSPLREGILDVYVSYDRSTIPAALREDVNAADARIRLTDFACNAAGAGATLTLKFTDGTTLLSTASVVSSSTRTWGTWRIYDWTNANDVVVRIVLSTAAFTAPYSGSGLTLSLHGCACEIRPKRLIRFRIFDDQLPGYTYIYGKPQFRAGYNISLHQEADVGNSPRVVLDCIPGAGLGKSEDPSCEGGSLALRTLNGQGPDEHGNVNIDWQDCYWSERKITLLGPPADPVRSGTIEQGKLHVHGDCQPCLDCDAVSNAYGKLHLMYQRFKNVQDRIVRAKGYYEHTIDKTNQLQSWYGDRLAKFRVFQQGLNNFTFRVVFRSAHRNFTRLQITLLTPAAFFLTYANGSGWVSTQGQPPRQNDAIFSVNAGLDFEVNTPVLAGGISYWQWSVYLNHDGSLPDPSTITDLQFACGITATELLKDGKLQDVVIDPMVVRLPYIH